MFKDTFQKIANVAGLNIPYFFQNGGWIAFRYSIVTVAGLFLTISLTRFLERESYGQLQFVLASLGVLSLFSLPGLNTASMKEAVNGNFGGVKKTVLYSFVTSLLISFFGIFASVYFSYKGDDVLSVLFFVAAMVAPFYYAPNNWYVFYESSLNFRMTTLRIASASSIVAISIFFLSSSLVPVEWILLAYLGIPAFFNWVFYFEAAKKFPGRIVGSSFDLKYALLCTVQKFTNTTINENVLILIVGLLFGVSELAFFQVAFFCFASLVGFFSALSSVYVPLLFKYKDIALWRHIFQNFCLGLIIVIPYVVLVWFLFVPVFGLEYSEGRSIALGFSLIVPFIPIKIFLLNYLISRNRNGFVSMTNIVSGFFAALSLWIFQGDGILFSVVVSYGLLNSIQIFLPSLAVIYFSPKDSRNTDSI